MNVLYLSYDGMTDPLGQSQVLPYIIGLTKENYEFTLISFEKKSNYNSRKNKIYEICKTNNIDWVPLIYTKNPPIFSTIMDRIQMLKKSIQLHRHKKFDIVHCRSYISALVGLKLKQKFGIKFIFDMRGFWADERVDGKIWNLKNPIFKTVYNYFKRKEVDFIKKSDKIVSLTTAGKNEMLKWKIDVSENKIHVIPCAADFNLFTIQNEETKSIARKELSINQNTFVVSYIGSIGTWYMLEEMLLFFKALKSERPDAKFLFLTPEKKSNILTKALSIGLESKDFIIKFSERNQIPKYLGVSNFSVFFILPAYSKLSSSPTKMGELLAMGIPIICNKNVGDVEEIIDQTKSGICIDIEKENNFHSVIQQMSNFQYESSEIREKAKKYYKLENGIKMYKALYKALF